MYISRPVAAAALWGDVFSLVLIITGRTKFSMFVLWSDVFSLVLTITGGTKFRAFVKNFYKPYDSATVDACLGATQTVFTGEGE